VVNQSCIMTVFQNLFSWRVEYIIVGNMTREMAQPLTFKQFDYIIALADFAVNIILQFYEFVKYIFLYLFIL